LVVKYWYNWFVSMSMSRSNKGTCCSHMKLFRSRELPLLLGSHVAPFRSEKSGSETYG
jgi:hypothetical protein